AIPAERLAEEVPHLTALDARPDYDTSRLCVRRVSRDCFVSLDTNRYSVPWAYVGRDVLIKATSQGFVQVLWQGQLIAQHLLSPARHQQVVNQAHYQGLSRKNVQKVLPQSRQVLTDLPVVEVRDLSYYDQLAEVAADA